MSEVVERKLRRRSATVCQRCSSDGAQRITYSDTLEHKGLLLDVHGLQTMRAARAAGMSGRPMASNWPTSKRSGPPMRSSARRCAFARAC